MAGVLILEVIVVGLTFPVVGTLTANGVTWASGLYLGVLCLIMTLFSGRQGEPYALKVNLVLQALVIAGGVFHWSIAVVGAVFLCVWVYIAYLKNDVEKRIARGQLPSQRQ
ncbi:MAG: DUF4233 domain-containing protein [Gordonia sp. (in: high G+C Gram-positive bacteria)]